MCTHCTVTSMFFRSSYAHYLGLWVLLFALSKVAELGDTIFIVLRKQNLIFLHWYHHILTLIHCWNSYAEQTGTGRKLLKETRPETRLIIARSVFNRDSTPGRVGWSIHPSVCPSVT